VKNSPQNPEKRIGQKKQKKAKRQKREVHRQKNQRQMERKTPNIDDAR
jgi:hypothetical protein